LRGYAEDGTYTLAAVIGSGGAMVSVSEAEIEEATRSLARICGLHVDPAAAAAIAGLEIATRRGIVSAGSSVIAIITGTGFKEVPADFSLAELGAVFDPDVDPIESILPQEVSHDTTSY
ncbi:pyridoxal-phosphate dependent enzyme, partial [Candidatus Bipolaricaulota bacterium]|nr:pyridoxal-phosphate dependent enzyme [Candidatus Bipolaricaulota bacterium]